MSYWQVATIPKPQPQVTFNIDDKCGSLTMVNINPKKYVDPFKPLLGSSPIPALKWEDRYKYLGCKLGANPKAALEESKRLFLEESTAIWQSLLTYWQKIDTIKRFTKPQLDYKLRTLLPSRSWAKDVDSSLKKGLRLPGRTYHKRILLLPPRRWRTRCLLDRRWDGHCHSLTDFQIPIQQERPTSLHCGSPPTHRGDVQKIISYRLLKRQSQYLPEHPSP